MTLVASPALVILQMNLLALHMMPGSPRRHTILIARPIQASYLVVGSITWGGQKHCLSRTRLTVRKHPP